MSGILLPGQENQPRPDEAKPTEESGSGLILPSGFRSHKKEQSSESQAEKSTAAEPTVAPPPPAGSSADDGQPQLNLKYPPSGAQIQCPNCGTSYTAPIFTIVDLGADPMLKAPLLGGQINVAVCPSCNTAGQLSVPMMLHVPEEEFLAVYVPNGGGLNDLQGQKMIGDLTQSLMRNTPKEERKGYMLQPQQFMDWNRLIEKVWGFDGVTPEMLRKQREQSALMQNLLRIGDDETALKLAIERNSQLVDREFFGLLEQMSMGLSSQGQSEAAQGLLALYDKLLNITDVGKEIIAQRERVQSILQKITPQTSRRELLEIILDVWTQEDGEEIVTALIMHAGPALDYQFLMELAQRIEKSQSQEETDRLNQLRELILAIQEQQKESQEAVIQQLQTVLQEVLQSEDTEAALRKYAHEIDENFLALLGANLQAAQKNKATAAVKRLQAVYQQALSIFQEKLPPTVRFIQALMGAPDSGTVRKLIQENRSIVTKELVETMSELETQMREANHKEQADRLKSLRGQVALML